MPHTLQSEGSNSDTLAPVDILDGELEVLLTNQADNRWVIADAVRIEENGEVVLAPEIPGKQGATEVTDKGAIDLGTEAEGSRGTHTVTGENSGTRTTT